MPELILGPLLRYVDEVQATVWVETDCACEVEVLGRKARTFCIAGHHYALVRIEELEPGSSHEYEVRLDGEVRWPEPDSEFPPSLIRTVDPNGLLRIAFGSCRVTVPHEPPYTLDREQDDRGRGNDALRAYALRMREQPPDEWPQLLLMLGDQIYADEDAPETRAFIRSHRDTSQPPGQDVANFEEYTRLYRESWGYPVVRWLLSTVGSAMVIDDHDVHDDWNISIDWVEEMRAQDWWEERIASALVSYWVYQFIGNLSSKLIDEQGLLEEIQEVDDAWPRMRKWALELDSNPNGRRWSYSRTLGRVRAVFMDSREGRVLEGTRRMFDEGEWGLLKERMHGDVDHLIVADTLPILMPPAVHDLESWNEAVCAGAWGDWFKGPAESLRRALDLEHWGAFRHSFDQIMGLVADVGAGRRGDPPASIVMLAGDIHHAYLAQAGFPRDEDVRSPVWQVVCSPYRNPLVRHERAIARFGSSSAARPVGRMLARSAGVDDPRLGWRLVQPPTFDNQIGTLTFEGRSAAVRIERATPGPEDVRLETTLERPLA